MDNHQAMVDEVIDKFNFERVQIAMSALDWQWQTTEGNGHAVPTLNKLKAMARHLLRESIKHERVSSGGLEARYYKKTKDDPEYFVLRFILTQADSYDD
jgi:hypothetical protein